VHFGQQRRGRAGERALGWGTARSFAFRRGKACKKKGGERKPSCFKEKTYFLTLENSRGKRGRVGKRTGSSGTGISLPKVGGQGDHLRGEGESLK